MDNVGAVEMTELENTFQTLDNVGLAETDRILQCLMICLRTITCITIFFNENTHQCILHSKTFHFRRPTNTGGDWKAYRLTDVMGRCPESFLYYRHLDLCYKIDNGTTDNMYFTDYRSAENQCNVIGSGLIRIDTPEKQAYMEHVLDGTSEDFVCIQGNSFQSREYTFDDGTNMSYFNWAPGQPDGLPNRLAMKPSSLLWYGVPIPSVTTCSFVCEHSINNKGFGMLIG